MATNESTEPKVNLSLDDLEKENPKGIFKFTIAGRVITMNDPKDIDWLTLAEIEDDPVQFVQECMSEPDGDFFVDQQLPSWKMDILIKDFMRHFGMGSRGKGRGSRR